jgi:hypothetical protein
LESFYSIFLCCGKSLLNFLFLTAQIFFYFIFISVFLLIYKLVVILVSIWFVLPEWSLPPLRGIQEKQLYYTTGWEQAIFFMFIKFLCAILYLILRWIHFTEFYIFFTFKIKRYSVLIIYLNLTVYLIFFLKNKKEKREYVIRI